MNAYRNYTTYTGRNAILGYTGQASNLFQEIENLYNTTPPIRGRAGDIRPVGNRRQDNFRTIKYDEDHYAIQFHYTDIMEVRKVKGRTLLTLNLYRSKTTLERFAFLFDRFGLRGKLDLHQQYGRQWIHYHDAGQHWALPMGDYTTVTFWVQKNGTVVPTKETRALTFEQEVADKEARRPYIEAAKRLRPKLKAMIDLSEGKLVVPEYMRGRAYWKAFENLTSEDETEAFDTAVLIASGLRPTTQASMTTFNRELTKYLSNMTMRVPVSRAEVKLSRAFYISE